ncbi:ATP-binding cassette domain-containing protein [Alcaligenaceae bacterium CGII-47]|nr:ATP-binding cassette domain-containing protein [Alcaligenaceae bacterium CGII-47]
MIRATGLTLRRGTKVLLDGAEFVIHPGERVGFVGKNGAGKTTLFALLQKQIDQDAGTLDIPAAWQLASVEQILHDTHRAAREFVIDGDTRLRALQARRAQTADEDGHAIAELEAALVDAQAWSAPSRAEQLLAGLGFTPEQWAEPVANFSGGWQMRIALARALMAPSDLLLLDEPTNHLDLDAMLWLERWLSSYPGTVLLISHDTEFLDTVARVILHFDQGKLVRYKGGYEDFLTQRAERMRQNQLAHVRQARESAHLQGFIDRFKAKATKAKQAQSRVKALARMQVLAPLAVESGIDIRLPSPTHTPDPLLRLDAADLGYIDAQGTPRCILSQVQLMVRSGARIGVLGVNGAGKSTLIKTLAQEITPLAGEYLPSKGLEIGYFAQQQLDMLDPALTPLEHLARIAPTVREQELRNYLGSFGFSGDTVKSPVAPFSGGEKARLALSLIVWRKPNLLLLDEPSNHLDVDTREALARALAEFTGSVLMVSHDRHLLRTTVDDFWIVADGLVQEFDGDLEDYRDWLQQRGSTARSEARSEPAIENDRKAQRRLDAQVRQQLAIQKKPLEARLHTIENEMSRQTQRLEALNALIADPAFYTDAHKATRPLLLAEHGELSKSHQALEDNWLQIQEELEALQSS